MNDENQPAGSPTASSDFAGAKQSKLSSTDRKTIQPTEQFAKNISALDPSALNPAATAQAPSTGLSMPDQSALAATPPTPTTPEPTVAPAPPASIEPVASPTAEPAATPVASSPPTDTAPAPSAPSTTTIQEAPEPAKKSGGLSAMFKGLFKRK